MNPSAASESHEHAAQLYRELAQAAQEARLLDAVLAAIGAVHD